MHKNYAISSLQLIQLPGKWNAYYFVHFQKVNNGAQWNQLSLQKSVFVCQTMIDFKKFNHHCAIIQMLFLFKNKSVWWSFFLRELTIASQTLATTITVGRVSAQGLKWPHLLFFRFWLIDWKTVRKEGSSGAPGQYKDLCIWKFLNNKSNKKCQVDPLLSLSLWRYPWIRSLIECHNDLRPSEVLQ